VTEEAEWCAQVAQNRAIPLQPPDCKPDAPPALPPRRQYENESGTNTITRLKSFKRNPDEGGVVAMTTDNERKQFSAARQHQQHAVEC